MFQWLENLGYDHNFVPNRSKSFMLCIHSSSQIDVTLEDTLKTDLEQRTNLLIIKKFGQEMKTHSAATDYILRYSLSDKIMAHSYAVQNLSNSFLKFELNGERSRGVTFSTSHSSITKTIRPKATEFYFHTM